MRTTICWWFNHMSNKKSVPVELYWSSFSELHEDTTILLEIWLARNADQPYCSENSLKVNAVQRGMDEVLANISKEGHLRATHTVGNIINGNQRSRRIVNRSLVIHLFDLTMDAKDWTGVKYHKISTPSAVDGSFRLSYKYIKARNNLYTTDDISVLDTLRKHDTSSVKLMMGNNASWSEKVMIWIFTGLSISLFNRRPICALRLCN